jgi:hypothetical protein
VSASDSTQDQIGGHEGVWISERSQRDILRRPRSNTREFFEGSRDFFNRLIEAHNPIPDRTREGVNRLAARDG